MMYLLECDLFRQDVMVLYVATLVSFYESAQELAVLIPTSTVLLHDPTHVCPLLSYTFYDNIREYDDVEQNERPFMRSSSTF